ncbi:hypothetical protein RJ639_029544 [Escallonia herrerae]|uniref:Uncharacterized protein n=1 Tax=Escallonia herrerae TaxID=1293975 RepID=A0AA88S4Z8_9ASTE|nr:hypothetical protein RJ639_029544 [Escallonia herrerae]
MVDGRSVMKQFNEIKTILDHYSQHKLALDEFIMITSIIDKLPPSWKNFRNSLKHRKEDINLDELGTHLRIEENLCKEEKSKSEDCLYPAHLAATRIPMANAAHNSGSGTLRPVAIASSSFRTTGFFEW